MSTRLDQSASEGIRLTGGLRRFYLFFYFLFSMSDEKIPFKHVRAKKIRRCLRNLPSVQPHHRCCIVRRAVNLMLDSVQCVPHPNHPSLIFHLRSLLRPLCRPTSLLAVGAESLAMHSQHLSELLSRDCAGAPVEVPSFCSRDTCTFF